MAFRKEHELHTRRRSRNMGMFIVLFGFVAVIFGLTMAKVRFEEEARPGVNVDVQINSGVSE